MEMSPNGSLKGVGNGRYSPTYDRLSSLDLAHIEDTPVGCLSGIAQSSQIERRRYSSRDTK